MMKPSAGALRAAEEIHNKNRRVKSGNPIVDRQLIDELAIIIDSEFAPERAAFQDLLEAARRIYRYSLNQGPIHKSWWDGLESAISRAERTQQ